MIRIQSFWRNLFTLLMLLCVSVAWGADYVITYTDGSTTHYLGCNGTALTDYTTFNPTTCLWNGESGSTFSCNGQYLSATYNRRSGVSFTVGTKGTNFTINNNRVTISLNNNTYYIKYNSGWTLSTGDNDTNGENRATATKTVKILGSTPSALSISNYKETVTISAEANSDKIYYTTDGTTPTTASTLYTGPFTVTGSPTIKAIAVRGTATSSTTEYTVINPTQGVSGGVVTLNDLQDHSWTLYQGVDESVDGGYYKGETSNYTGRIYLPDPCDVKITYYGNGTGTVIPASGTANDATTVKVGIDANASTFVYYKTLEKLDGNYTYRTICNPFSVRPKVSTTYYGFSYWRVKSITGGSITGVASGGQMNADTEYTFVPTNEYGMEVELEAVWEPAEVSTNGTFSQGYNSVERNFYVVQTGGFTVISTPCTYSSIYPNGTTNGTTAATGATLTRKNAFTARADCKIEYLNFDMTGDISGDGLNFAIGRGVSTANTCANVLYGCNKNITNPNFHTRIESGKFNYMSYLGGYYTYTGGSNGGTGRTITVNNTNNTRVRITMGSDYDRAVGDDDKLIMQYAMMMARGSSISLANRNNGHFLFVNVKSGKLGLTQFMSKLSNSSGLTARQGGAGYGHYMSSSSSQTYVGCRSVFIEGGQLSTIGSGIDLYTKSASNDGTNPYNTDFISYRFRMSGGTIHGNVYGGAAKSPAGGDRQMIMTGGTVEGWFAAGCNGTDNDGGQTYGESFVYIGGTGKVNSNNNGLELGYCNGGNVYAAGAGRSGTTTCGEMSNGTNLVIADNCEVERGIYGGGNYGYAKSGTHSNIYITGGTNLGRNDVYSTTTSKGAVFGGANQQSGPDIKIFMTGGEMRGGVYGGSNTKGDVPNVTMKILGGQVGTDATTMANVCGGGYGSSTNVAQKVDVTIGDATSHTGPKIYGDVYGGSQMGKTNTSATNANTLSTYTTTVAMNGGRVYGDIYGGGFGENGNAADVSGNVTVNVTGGTVWGVNDEEHGGVYGGNNLNGTPKGTITVNVSGSDAAPTDKSRLAAIRNVFGGGNKAAYTGSPAVNISGGHTHYVFGGAQEANIIGNSHVNVTGGKANNIFGGNYKAGTISGTITVDINWTDTNWRNNTANKDFVGNVYGGGYLAAYTGSPKVNFINGRSQKVNDDILGNVYGGGYGLSAEGKTGTALTEAQNAAVIEGNPTVTIGDWNNDHKVTIGGSVFGGGAMAAVEGNPTVTVNDCDTEIGGDVYGGGDAAPVYSTTTTIWGGTIKGNVFGGGNGKDKSKNSNGAQVGYTRNDTTNGGTGNTDTKIYGGTFGTWSVTPDTCAANTGGIFGGSNMNGNIRGKIKLFVGEPTSAELTAAGASTCSFKIKELYGAGNEAAYVGTGGVDCELGCVSGIDYIYGGAKNCNFTGNVDLKLTNGKFKAVFGGNNLGGNLDGTIKVTIDETGCQPLEIDELYGGGDQAAYTGSPVVNVVSCSYIGNIYGAGKGDPTDNTHTKGMVTGNPVVNIYQIPGKYVPGTVTNGVYTSATSENDTNETGAKRLGYIGNIFGGGNAAKVDGNTTVNIATAVTGVTTVGTGADAGKLQVAHPTGTDQTTKVNIGANIFGNVYGGGNEADVTGKTTVNIGNE